MKTAVVFLVLVAVLTSVMAPAVFASPASQKAAEPPVHVKLSQPQ